ncbi:MAG: GTPase RsgA, partial [Bifidobacteriaceae bacterium]|nr:GTPase RsgA [Bifidobacteriaceae bacterium]
TGGVNAVTGRGRHTSTGAEALPLPAGGWAIDTPGIRSFGLAHVSQAHLLAAFPDLADVAAGCPRGCTHLDGSPDCELDEWAAAPGLDPEEAATRRGRLDSVRRLLEARAAEDRREHRA